MTKFCENIRKTVGRFFKKLGRKIYYEPNFDDPPKIEAIYVSKGMDRIQVRHTFSHHFSEMVIPYEEFEEDEARTMAIELSKRLIPYIREEKNDYTGLTIKELTVYVMKNGED